MGIPRERIGAPIRLKVTGAAGKLRRGIESNFGGGIWGSRVNVGGRCVGKGGESIGQASESALCCD